MLKDYLRWGIYACLLVTPFLANYVSDTMFFPFITGKNFAFRILVECAVALYVILALVDTTVRPKYTHLLGAFGAFIAIIFAADVFGVDPHKSLWSNYERSEGFVTHIHLFLYFLVMASVMRTEKLWTLLANSWLVSSAFIFISGVNQMKDKHFFMGGSRVDAGLGNSEYIGIFGIFNAFLAALLFARTKKGDVTQYWYVAIGLVNVALVFMSQTRGSMIGLAGGTMLSLCLFALLGKQNVQLRKYAIAVTGAIVLFGAALMLNPEAGWVKAVPALDRVAHIRLSEGTADSRLTIWKMSWVGFKDHPILGWGQENFIQVFSEHFDPAASRLEPWYDRSHDVFFDWLIAGGSLGLISYLALYVVALYYLWYFDKGSRFTLSEKVIVTGMFAAYFIHNIFVFDSLMSYMFFFGVLSWIAQRSSPREVKSEKIASDSLDIGDVAIVGAVVMTVLVVAIYYVNVRNIVANQELIMTLQGDLKVMRDGKPYPRIAALVEPGLIGTNEAREQLIQQSLSVAQQAHQGKVENQFAQEYLVLADKSIKDRLDEMPRDLRMISFAMTFYGNLGQMDQAEVLFKQGTLISPKRGALYLEMAQLRGAKGDYASALDASSKAIEYMPGNPQAYGLQGLLLAYAGRGSEIDALYAAADKYVNGQTRLQFAQAYQKAGDAKKAQMVAMKAVNEDPSLAEQLKPKSQDKQ